MDPPIDPIRVCVFCKKSKLTRSVWLRMRWPPGTELIGDVCPLCQGQTGGTVVSLYSFLISEAVELVLREAKLDLFHMNRDAFLGALLVFDRMRIGMMEVGLLDLRQAQHVSAILNPVLDRYRRERNTP